MRASQVPDDDGESKMPLTAMLIIFTVAAVLLLVAVALGIRRCHSRKNVSPGNNGKTEFLSAGVPVVKGEDSDCSAYSRLTPQSDEFTAVTGLGSVSMSVTGVKDVVKDGSAQTLAGGAGSNSRRPLWMQLDASGSIRSLLHSRERSGRASDSGTASHSGATVKLPGRNKYMAEFGKGSPVKSLLRCGTDEVATDKMSPMRDSSWNISQPVPERVSTPTSAMTSAIYSAMTSTQLWLTHVPDGPGWHPAVLEHIAWECASISCTMPLCRSANSLLAL
jgi:hypothetical protein